MRGNYCLETDLDPNEPKRKVRDLNLHDTIQDALSQFDFVEEEAEEESSGTSIYNIIVLTVVES